MVSANNKLRSAMSKVLLVGGGALGALLTLYVYSFGYLVLGPRPLGALLGLEHLPALAGMALYDAWPLAVPAALFGAAAIGAAARLSERLPALPALAFASLFACTMAAASYLAALVCAPLSDHQLQHQPSFFVAVGGFAFVASGYVRWRGRSWRGRNLEAAAA